MIPFATGSCGYTLRFAKYVVDLLRGMTLKDTANLLDISWDTVKEIHTRHLENHYAPPSLEGVESIGIDEFAVRKGQVYKTIVVDLKSGCIIYNFIVNLLAGIAAYCCFPKKPCINVSRTVDTQLALFRIRRFHFMFCQSCINWDIYNHIAFGSIH